MAMASHCRLLSLRPGGLVFEQGTLADAQMTILGGSVQLRRQGGGEGNGGEDGCCGGAAWGGELRPAAPPGAPQRQSDAGGSAGGIRARLRREREGEETVSVARLKVVHGVRNVCLVPYRAACSVPRVRSVLPRGAPVC